MRPDEVSCSWVRWVGDDSDKTRASRHLDRTESKCMIAASDRRLNFCADMAAIFRGEWPVKIGSTPECFMANTRSFAILSADNKML